METETVVVMRHKLNVDEYYRMADAGILGEDDRVELIDGELIDMGPIGTDHAVTVNGLNKALVMACGDRAIVSVQNPLRLNPLNEPQPDFSVLRPRAGDFRTGERPTPAEILLVVEVSDSSLRFDRKVKLPLYASFGIQELWIVDLVQRQLDVYRRPQQDGYAETASFGPGDTAALWLGSEIKVPLARVFG